MSFQCLLLFVVLSYGETAAVLYDDYDNINESISAVTFDELSKNVAKLCGAEFCPGVTAALNPNLASPDDSKIQMLMMIFFGMMIAACLLIAVGVDGLERYEMGRKGSGSELSGFRLLSVTLKQMLQVKQILLLPITMFIGAEQAFMAVDFTSVRVRLNSLSNRPRIFQSMKKKIYRFKCDVDIMFD